LSALNLIMIAMTDQHQRVPLLGKLDGFYVNLCHQRASRIDNLQTALLRPVTNSRRNSMSRVDDPCALRHLVQLVDKDCALLGEVGHNIAVMNNLFANIDRSAKGLQCYLNNIDRTHNAGTEAAWLKKENPFSFRFDAASGYGSVVKGGCSHVSQYTAFKPVSEQN
jgi:hypothetical protein